MLLRRWVGGGTIKPSTTHLRDDITTIHEATGHIFAVTRITLRHHVGRFKDRASDFSNRECLMICLFGADDRRIRREQEMNSWIRHEICLYQKTREN